MFSLLLLLPLALNGAFTTSTDITLARLSRDNYFPYQDILINGNCIWKGLGTDCPSRYTAIHAALKAKYNRPITILDIGANNGYFSLRLANDFNGHATMVDTSDRLADIVELNTNLKGQLTYIKKQLTSADLDALTKDRKYDVVIALHVLHHIPEWEKFMDSMFKAADTVIIETPPANDARITVSGKKSIPAIESKLINMHGSVICETARVKPAVHHKTLNVMTSSYQPNVETLPGVKSKMFMFHSFKK